MEVRLSILIFGHTPIIQEYGNKNQWSFPSLGRIKFFSVERNKDILEG
jgi:hypothetical protein